MMAETKIEWADYTFNPWRGCTKVSPGCANCYAEAMSHRNPGTLGVWGPQGTRVVAAESYWRQPVKWDEAAQRDGVRRRVFCASLADVFEEWGNVMRGVGGGFLHHADRWTRQSGKAYIELDDIAIGKSRVTMADVRQRLFNLIDDTPHLDWLLVTKRPENVLSMTPDYSYHACVTGDCPHWDDGDCDKNTKFRENVWLLTSAENQDTADQRVPELLKCRDLCPVLGLSVEPLLGPVDIMQAMQDENDFLDWVIVGGESGPGSRSCAVEWIRSIVRQCAGASVPCFVKQLGAQSIDDIDGTGIILRDKKGGDPSEWPGDLRVRQFPTNPVGRPFGVEE